MTYEKAHLINGDYEGEMVRLSMSTVDCMYILWKVANVTIIFEGYSSTSHGLVADS